MSKSFLHSAISEALPELSDVTREILEETLQSLGVESPDDFQFLKEDDLMSALRPIQARKLVSAWRLKCKFNVIVQHPDCLVQGSHGHVNIEKVLEIENIIFQTWKSHEILLF